MPPILAHRVSVPFKKFGFRVRNVVGIKACFGWIKWRKLSALKHLGGWHKLGGEESESG